MEEQCFGRITDMVRRADGDELTADAAIGATTLYVGDVTDFDEDGGMLVLGTDDPYTYSTVDVDANTIALSDPLVSAATSGDLVTCYDEQLGEIVVEYVAHVLLDDQDRDDEPIEVTVPHFLVNYIKEEVRGGYAEAVTLVRDGEDDLMIWQVEGKLVQDIALEQVRTEHGDALAELQGDLTELNTVTLPGVQADLATLDGKFPIGSTDISDGAISTPKLAANAVTAAKIVAGAITGDKIAANTIGADRIVANSIGTDRLAANAIDGMTITGVALVNVAGGWGMTGPGLIGPSFTTTINNVGDAYFMTKVSCDGPVHGESLWSDVIDTTANAANTYMATTGKLQKSTSSLRYKKNIEPADLDVEALLSLQPRSYQSRNSEDGAGRFVGFIAEEAHDLGLTEFVVYDEEGQPDGFAYPMFTAALQAICQDQQTRLDALTERLEALEAAQ